MDQQSRENRTEVFLLRSLKGSEGIALLVLLVLLAIPWVRGIDRGEVHLITDETRHAMSGVFLFDFFHDLPLRWPLQYAAEYYGKYPAMAIGHWPPGFYVVEALFFAVLGISPWVSRLAVLPFVILGAVFWYKIARDFARIELAFASTVLFSCLPSVLLYEKSTMLEIPVLALCLGAIYFWLLLLRSGRKRDLYVVALFSAAAFLTKQTAIFLFLLFVFHLLFERKWKLLKWIHTYVALAAVLLLVVPWYLLAMRMHPVATAQAVGAFLGGGRHPSMAFTLEYYLRSLPGDLGLPLLVLSLLGIGAAIVSKQKAALGLFLSWILACYVTFTAISDKSPRYIMPWLLPFAFFAAYLVWWVLSRYRRAATLGLAGLAAFYFVPAVLYQRPFVEGCQEAARLLSQQPNADLLFYQGLLNGDFIFFVRKFDPQKRRLVFREKIVDVTDPRWREMHPGRPTAEEIEHILLGLGIQYFVVENRDFSPELKLTRLALQSNQFELVKEVPIQTNDPRLAGVNLLIYRPRKPQAPTVDAVRIPMESLPYDLKLSLPRLVGHPWPPGPP